MTNPLSMRARRNAVLLALKDMLEIAEHRWRATPKDSPEKRAIANARIAIEQAVPTAEEIAKLFADKLRSWLTEDEWVQMSNDNADEPEGSGICHSHDYCDANMAMDEVLRELGFDMGDDVDAPAPDGQMPDATVELWNTVWDIAKKKYLSQRTETATEEDDDA